LDGIKDHLIIIAKSTRIWPKAFRFHTDPSVWTRVLTNLRGHEHHNHQQQLHLSEDELNSQTEEAALDRPLVSVSLANNHVLDAGFSGLYSTMMILKQSGVSCAGAGQTLLNAQAPAIVLLTVSPGTLGYTMIYKHRSMVYSGFIMGYIDGILWMQNIAVISSLLFSVCLISYF
jgi:hypothetical protein